jgi:hypothetical protein
MTNIEYIECDIEILKELFDSTLSDYQEMLRGKIPMDRELLLAKLGDAVAGANGICDMITAEETA